MRLLRVAENRAIKKMSLKIEKHEKIAMLAISALNTISSLISKALSDDSISDQEYSLILLQFETFTRMKEDSRIKSKTSICTDYLRQDVVIPIRWEQNVCDLLEILICTY